MRDDRITDIEIGGHRWTHEDWEKNTYQTISEIANAMAAEFLKAAITSSELKICQGSGGDSNSIVEPSKEKRLHAPFLSKALRDNLGVAPSLEFPN